jgi:hypothetical protein
MKITTFVDAPCGDFNWMKTVVFPEGVHYIGADIVTELINNNNFAYRCESRHFIKCDICVDILPKADILLCRDCLVHLSAEFITQAIANFKKSGSTYLLTTTFPTRTYNYQHIWNDAATGMCGWQPLNLQIAPFNFPAPLQLINEHCTENGGIYSDKCLGLWRLDDL